MPNFERWDIGQATAIVQGRAAERGAALPIMHDLMERFGYVDRAIVPAMAEALNLSKAEVFGTLTFYHDFRDHPPGRRTIKVCRAEACQSRGAAEMGEVLRRRLGVDWHGTTVDGSITVEPVFCLGLCACAPAVLLDDEPIGNVNVERVDSLIEEARA